MATGFNPVITSTATLSNQVNLELTQFVQLQYAEIASVVPLATIKFMENAQSVTFSNFDQLAIPAVPTPLIETAEIPAVAISDSTITLTPVEYGNSVKLSRKERLNSMGRSDMVAMQLVTTNMANTLDQLAHNALNSSTNVLFTNGVANTAAIAATDQLDRANLETLYLQLQANNVPFHPMAMPGTYALVVHPRAVSSLRSAAGPGTWTDIVQHGGGTDMILKNAIGVYAGFTIILSTRTDVQVGAGMGGIDIFTAHALGENALGVAMTVSPEIDVSDLAVIHDRVKSVSWYSVLQFALIRPESNYKIESAGA